MKEKTDALKKQNLHSVRALFVALHFMYNKYFSTFFLYIVVIKNMKQFLKTEVDNKIDMLLALLVLHLLFVYKMLYKFSRLKTHFGIRGR